MGFLSTISSCCRPTNNAVSDCNPSKVFQDLRPLFLTPFILSGRALEGRQKSRVRKLHSSKLKSFSGYLTVNEEYQSNLFFWFFRAEIRHEEAPLMIWLEGGPGESGLFAVFVLHGPFKVNAKMQLESRKTSWTKLFNMLYIDQPVGSGYSFTKSTKGYATNLTESTDDLYLALTQFLVLFPEYRGNDFYVAGISYGGKFAAGLAQRIIRERELGTDINLKGMIIASGFIDPIAMVDKSDYLYQVGLIDKDTLDWGKEQYAMVREEYKKGNTAGAAMMALDMNSRIAEVAGYHKTADSLPLETAPHDYFYYQEFVQKYSTRSSLHVGNETFNPYYGPGGTMVTTYMVSDLINGIKELMEEILNTEVPVLLFHGNMDITLANEHLLPYLRTLNWSGAKILKETMPAVWRVNGELAGRVVFTDTLVYAIVRNSGHCVVYDQPEWSFEILKVFVYSLQVAMNVNETEQSCK